MLAGRSARDSRFGDKMIRRAQIEDANRLAEIHIFGWRAAYREIVSDQYLFSKLSVIKRAESFRKVIEENSEETFVCDEDGIIKAFMTIGKCRNSDKPNSFELWGLYVDPCFKRNGIGKKMLSFCETEAKERGFLENCLWVFNSNKNSIVFYEKMGYSPDGKKEIIEYFKAIEMRYVKAV